MNITFDAMRVELEASFNRDVRVSAEIDDISDVLDNFTIEEIIAHYGTGEVLDKIGESEAREHFGIEEE